MLGLPARPCLCKIKLMFARQIESGIQTQTSVGTQQDCRVWSGAMLSKMQFEQGCQASAIRQNSYRSQIYAARNKKMDYSLPVSPVSVPALWRDFLPTGTMLDTQ